MINRSHFPDKVAVNLELTKYHQFKKDAITNTTRKSTGASTIINVDFGESKDR